MYDETDEKSQRKSKRILWNRIGKDKSKQWKPQIGLYPALSWMKSSGEKTWLKIRCYLIGFKGEEFRLRHYALRVLWDVGGGGLKGLLCHDNGFICSVLVI